MKIPIKRYEPDPQAIAAMNTVLGEEYSENDPIRLLATELQHLLAHHEEETKWMYAKLKEQNEAPVDMFGDGMGGES